MEKSTKIIVGILIIALIIMGIVLWTSKEEIKETDKKNSINQINITQSENNLVQNKEEDTENKIENIVSEDKQDEILNETTEVEDLTNTSQTVDNQKKEENNNEKAINMVKNDWGADDSVSFKIDEQTEDGKYVVSVVDKNTTKVIMWYDVDINNNTIQEK